MLQHPKDIREAVLVTHANCLDGSSCAVMFLSAGGQKKNLRYRPAGSLARFVREDELIQTDRFLIFADVGFNKGDERCADELQRRGNCVLLDHHASSLPFSDRPFCLIDDGACGTELLRRYLVEGGARDLAESSYVNFARVVDDNDRWQNKMLPLSADLAKLRAFVDNERFVDEFVGSIRRRFAGHDGGIYALTFTEFETSLLVHLELNRQRACKRAIGRMLIRQFEMGNSSFNVGYTFSGDQNTSSVLDEMLKAEPTIAVAAQISLDSNRVSLRSRSDGVDVGKMAESLGGGGHRHAAGHQLPAGFLDSLLDDLYGEEPRREELRR